MRPLDDLVADFQQSSIAKLMLLVILSELFFLEEKKLILIMQKHSLIMSHVIICLEIEVTMLNNLDQY